MHTGEGWRLNGQLRFFSECTISARHDINILRTCPRTKQYTFVNDRSAAAAAQDYCFDASGIENDAALARDSVDATVDHCTFICCWAESEETYGQSHLKRDCLLPWACLGNATAILVDLKVAAQQHQLINVVTERLLVAVALLLRHRHAWRLALVDLQSPPSLRALIRGA
jgi:hypothetical protein